MREDYLQKRGLLELSISYGMDNLCLLEVGSFAGESMEIFNSTGLFKTIICVDTWSDLKSEHEFNSYSKMILVEHQFDQKKKTNSETCSSFGELCRTSRKAICTTAL